MSNGFKLQPAWALVWLGTAISMWLLAGFWHKIVMPSFYEESHGATHSGVFLILVAYLVLAALMCLLHLSTKESSINWYYKGIAIGLFMGITWVFPHQLAMAGAHEESLSYVFKNVSWHLVEQGVGGLVMAYLFQKWPLG